VSDCPFESWFLRVARHSLTGTLPPGVT